MIDYYQIAGCYLGRDAEALSPSIRTFELGGCLDPFACPRLFRRGYVR